METLKNIWSEIKVVAVKAANFLYTHKKYIGIALVAIILFVSGWFACRHFSPRIVERQVPVTVEKRVEVPVEVPVAVKGDTEIRYIEKTSPSDSDIEIHQEPPQISMKYNDEEYKIDGVKGETQKFENGKLDVKQSSTATIDVTPIVDREVTKAVDENTKTITAQKDAEIKQVKKDETTKRHKYEFGSFAAGLGTGLLLMAF